MGLEQDLYDAFNGSIGIDDMDTGGDDGKIGQLASDIKDAIINFLTKQTFTITEMKASLEVEEIKTVAPLNTATMAPLIAPGPTGGGIVPPGPLLLQPLNLAKAGGGMGGMTIAVGHAYVGKPAMAVPKQDTSLEWNDFTKVKLDPNKIVEE